MRVLAAVVLTSLLMAPAFAKLPPPTEEAKAKAAEAAVKAAWTDKVGAYKLCLTMDRISAAYHSSAGASAPTALPTPSCADPGPFAAGAPDAKPLEASGAHSPAATATSPPSTNATSAEKSGQPK